MRQRLGGDVLALGAGLKLNAECEWMLDGETGRLKFFNRARPDVHTTMHSQFIIIAVF